MSQGGVFGGRAGQQARGRLGRALRNAREAAGLSAEQLAALLGTSQSSISRYETGQAVPRPELLDRWAEQLGVHESNRGALAELREEAGVEAITWRGLHRQLSPAQVQEEVAAMERQAKRVRAFDPVILPGLLQSPPYARAVYRSRGLDGAELDAAVTARLARAEGLYAPGLDLHVLVGQGALEWRMLRPELWAAQLGQLAQHADDLPGLRLGVLPFGREVATWHSHGFVLFDLPDGPAVHVETHHAAVNVLDPDEAAAYERTFEALAGEAVEGPSATALLRELAARARQERG